MEVLLVDDEPNLLEQAKLFLEKEENNLKIETTFSAVDALKKIKNNDYDAVVSDYQMPKMNGLEFLETLRENDNEIPFIIFTGRGREKVAMKALNLGADRYLQKGGDRTQYGVLANAIIEEVKHTRAEKSLRESEREKALVLDNTSEMIVHQNTQHEIKWANKTAARYLNKEPEELVGCYCYELWHSREEPCGDCPVNRAIEYDEVREGEITTVDGKTWLVRGAPVHDENGEVIGAVEHALDITKRKLLQEKEQEAEIIIDAMPDPVIVFDTESKIVKVNRALLNTFEMDSQEIVGESIMEIPVVKKQDEEVIEKFLSLLEEALNESKSGPTELEIVSLQGDKLHLSAAAAAIKDGDGNARRIVATLRDITDKRKMEETVSNATSALISSIGSEELFQAIVDNAREISGAKFVTLSFFSKKEEKVQLEALSGADPSILNKISNVLSVEDLHKVDLPVENTPSFKEFSEKKVREPVVLDGFHEFTFGIFDENTCELVEKIAGIGEIVAIPLFEGDEKFIGILGYLFEDEKEERNLTNLMIFADFACQALEKSKELRRESTKN